MKAAPFTDEAWEIARKVAAIDKQLLSGQAVEAFAALAALAEQNAARRCAGLLKKGAEIQRRLAEQCKQKNRWAEKEMSVSESGTEAYLTAANALDFWEYQICREFGLSIVQSDSTVDREDVMSGPDAPPTMEQIRSQEGM